MQKREAIFLFLVGCSASLNFLALGLLDYLGPTDTTVSDLELLEVIK